ncbi:MAG: NADH-quinone oxidoreductase subunit J [Deltaproteobacteria bacterium]|nr:NADH-quinone oxidoreductase subunit J [Deltaproteobacteria bacterium]
MDYLTYLIYGLYLLLIVVGALGAVISPSLVRALVGLIMTLFGVAGMYFLMAAPFMALMQLLIYVGAVSVLIFFAIMLTRVPDGEAAMESQEKGSQVRALLAFLTGLIPTFVLAGLIIKKSPMSVALKPESSLARLGEFLVGPYALAFELISVVLFAAMAGAVLLGFERRKAR